jgi:hypothetical protein
MPTINDADAEKQLARIVHSRLTQYTSVSRKVQQHQHEKSGLASLVDAPSKETLYLFSTSANAQQIQKGLADYAQGIFQASELFDS